MLLRIFKLEHIKPHWNTCGTDMEHIEKAKCSTLKLSNINLISNGFKNKIILWNTLSEKSHSTVFIKNGNVSDYAKNIYEGTV
tara:strand:+ start:199 stop:447 length:249 start_codon:yes stop_codon:yes gene_type:complete